MAGPADLRTFDGMTTLKTWRLNLLRAGYALLGIGLVVVEWPKLVDLDAQPLKDGAVTCMLVAMSALGLLGLRYPLRMLPILLFESLWKLLWLGVVALPLWTGDRMDAATREVAVACCWVVLILAVVPWRFVVTRYVTGRGDRLR
jgi:hypothetical protein